MGIEDDKFAFSPRIRTEDDLLNGDTGVGILVDDGLFENFSLVEFILNC